MHEWKIGDEAEIIASGKRVTITDILISVKTGTHLTVACDGDEYDVQPDEIRVPPVKVEYTWSFDVQPDVVICRFGKKTDGKEEHIMRGHGHIIHDGEIGIAQAASYALKKICDKLDGTILDGYDVRADK